MLVFSGSHKSNALTTIHFSESNEGRHRPSPPSLASIVGAPTLLSLPLHHTRARLSCSMPRPSIFLGLRCMRLASCPRRACRCCSGRERGRLGDLAPPCPTLSLAAHSVTRPRAPAEPVCRRALHSDSPPCFCCCHGLKHAPLCFNTKKERGAGA